MLCYLKGTINIGIVWGLDLAEYYKKYNPMRIVGYADSSYTRDSEDRKLIIRYCFFFGRGIITWYSKQ